MNATGITPILNVSSFEESFEWFAKFGWKKAWDWGQPPTFGCVTSGKAQIFLCKDAQGGRGRSATLATFGPDGDETGDKGVWMSVWVDDVDPIYERCRTEGIEVTWPPTDMPWETRELHVRHPDGHIFRISARIDEHD
jgi:hypothetical protein